MGIIPSDIRKIMLNTCFPEKHVAIAGGGKNYCHNSLDGAPSKDNYTGVVGLAIKVTKVVKEHVLPARKTETEIEIPE